MSVTYQVSRTICSGCPPPSATTARMLASAWRACATRPKRNSPSGLRPIMPPTKIVSPRALFMIPSRDERAHRIGGEAAQFEALELSGLRARQAGDIFDGARIFERRDRGLHVLLQGLGQRSVADVAGPQHDIGLDDMAAFLVRRRHHAAFRHRRMLEQRG